MDCSKIAFAMVVGPNESDIAIDSLESIKFFYQNADIWILDDCTNDGTFFELQRWSEKNGSFLYRNKEPRGYFGLVNSVFYLLSIIANSGIKYAFVVKMDTDACILDTGLEEHSSRLFELYGPGMIGAYRIAANGTTRDFKRQRRNIFLDLIPIGFHRDKKSFRWGLPFYTPYFWKAIKKGYLPGEHVLGGIYILHSETVVELQKDGFLAAIPDKYRAMTIEEDLLVSMGVKGIGHSLIDINQNSNEIVAWIQYKSPLPLSANNLLSMGIMAVHPVKKGKQGDEARLLFKQQRRSG